MKFLRLSGAATRLIAAALVTTSATGCGAWPYASHDVDVALHAVFHQGGMKVQAAAAPYTVADVAHLYLQVYRVVGTAPSESEVTLVDAQNAPVVLHIARDDASATLVDMPRVIVKGLKSNSRYRVKARAYTGGDQSSGTLISVDGPASQTDLQLVAATAATVVPSAVQVQLINRTFDGKARGPFVTITPGGFTGEPYEEPTL